MRQQPILNPLKYMIIWINFIGNAEQVLEEAGMLLHKVLGKWWWIQGS